MAPRSKSPALPLADYEAVETSTLAGYFRNPRRGNVSLIVDSLKKHGQYKPLIVNRGTKTGRPNEVLAGNHLLQAGLKIGLPTMEVRWLDVDDEEAARIVLVDNRASDKGTYDTDELGNLLLSLGGDLSGTGYSDGDLTKLLNEAGGLEPILTDPDAVPDLPEEPRTKLGYVWKLGEHRLVCGDSTFVDVLKTAAGDWEAPIDCLWTDPPYGVEYVGKTKDALKIQNDDKPGLAGLLFEMFESALAVLRPGAPCYIAHADTERLTFEAALREAGYLVRQNLIWVKNTLVLGRSDYQYKHEPILEAETPPPAVSESEAALAQLLEGNVSRETLEPDDSEVPGTIGHEPVLYGFTPGAKGRLGRGGESWYGNNKQTTVFQVDKPSASRVHPTMKPVELIVAMLRNSVVRGGTVLDFCAGSGSTLIACHQLGLRARLVELEPAYCDVICRRFQEATGTMPILESTGKPVSFTKEA